MNKVLILGINGFTGYHFQRYIEKHGLSRKYRFLGVDKAFNGSCAIKFKKADLLNYRSLSALITDYSPDYIINFAGIFSSKDIDTMLEINACVSKNLFEIILKNSIKVKNVLLIGSAAEYGLNSKPSTKESERLCPMNYYGLSKVIQTEYAQFYNSAFNINVNVARTFNMIGEHISPSLSIGSFVSQINNAANGDSINVGNLNTKRDFLDVEDVIDAYWKIVLKGKPGTIYNVCSGKAYFMKDVLRSMIRRSKKRISVTVRKDHFKKNDIPVSYGDNSKLRKDTGWKEKSGFEAAISRIIR